MVEQESYIQSPVLSENKEYRTLIYAGLLGRTIARIIDGIILIILSIIPLALLFYLMGSIASTNRNLLYPSAIVIVLCAIVIAWLYEAGFESSKHMATPGKMICSLKVTNLEGQRITFGTATIRFVVKSAIPSLIQTILNSCFSTPYILVDVFAMYTNEKRQCLHDMVAGTVVVQN